MKTTFQFYARAVLLVTIGIGIAIGIVACGGGSSDDNGSGSDSSSMTITAPDGTENGVIPPALTPRNSPQASGTHRSQIIVSGTGNIEELHVFNGSRSALSIRAGEWFEPKDGDHQRMIVTRDVTIPANEFIQIPAACRQFTRGAPESGGRFFSREKSIESSTLDQCQINCLTDGGNVQDCVWGCEDDSNLPPPGTSSAGSVRFFLEDLCPRETEVDARFFGYVGTSTAGSPDVTWPGSDFVYTTNNSRPTGDFIDQTLSSQGISTICYGAQEDGGGNKIWGRGIRPESSCAGGLNCCFAVPQTGIREVRASLSCP